MIYSYIYVFLLYHIYVIYIYCVYTLYICCIFLKANCIAWMNGWHCDFLSRSLTLATCALLDPTYIWVLDSSHEIMCVCGYILPLDPYLFVYSNVTSCSWVSHFWMWQSHGDVASLSEMPFPEDEKSAFFSPTGNSLANCFRCILMNESNADFLPLLLSFCLVLSPST